MNSRQRRLHIRFWLVWAPLIFTLFILGVLKRPSWAPETYRPEAVDLEGHKD